MRLSLSGYVMRLRVSTIVDTCISLSCEFDCVYRIVTGIVAMFDCVYRIVTGIVAMGKLLASSSSFALSTFYSTSFRRFIKSREISGQVKRSNCCIYE